MFILLITIGLLKKVEVNKQYRQSVMNGENVDFPGPVIQIFQKIKIMTMVIVYEKSPKKCMRC